MPSISLCNIQVELLEEIVGYIDSYQWISCHPGRTDIWKMLSIKPHLAARLQRLEIHRHEDFALPKSLLTLSEYEEPSALAEELDTFLYNGVVPPLLTELIGHTNLTRFYCNFLMDGMDILNNMFIKLFEHSPGLQELHITATVSRSSNLLDSLNLNPKKLPMLSLRAVVISLSFYQVDTLGLHVILVDLLIHSCPSIVDLKLQWNGASNLSIYIPQFLLRGNWPKLARLTLEGDGHGFYSNGLSDAEKSLIMRNFLSRHSTLKCLSLPHDFIFKDCIGEDSLPNL
ncbi:hypothetical protein M422DRAFT_274195 [Sphaerobolus stellatus SS14]|uniref:FBD domain-containing protein n=1 Tax=Sphaerobolus stellatus (strain SS14) TaxID=990650 RepID=A0A0C9UIC2_SPHS4|nr:hypothetical protein M422DRAFT_274195 [Sphaerobolus stellatus SS14]